MVNSVGSLHMNDSGAPDDFAEAAKQYRFHYFCLFPLALFEGFLFGPRGNPPLLLIVLAEFVLIAYGIALLMALFTRNIRHQSWGGSVQAGFWTGLTWIALLMIVNLLKA